MQTVTVGIVGAGFAANLHAESLRSVRGIDVRIGAVAAAGPSRAQGFAERHHVPVVHESLDALLADPGIDVVCVCTPNAAHESVIVRAAEAGKHVICEKPLTGAFPQPFGEGVARAEAERDAARGSIERIGEAVRRGGVRFMYAENWIYAPAVAKTRRLLQLAGGSIIDLRAEESHSGSHSPATRNRATSGGGALLVMASHPIAAVLHTKQYEAGLRGVAVRAESVTAEVAPLYASPSFTGAKGRNWLVSDWTDVETWANLVIGFSDGTKAVVNASFAMLGGVRNVFDVFTTNAVYQNNMTPNSALQVYTPEPTAFGDEYLHEKIETRTGWISAAPDEDWIRGYPQEMQDFMECVAEDREPLSGLALASSVIDIIYAGYESAARGERIRLDA